MKKINILILQITFFDNTLKNESRFRLLGKDPIVGSTQIDPQMQEKKHRIDSPDEYGLHTAFRIIHDSKKLYIILIINFLKM